MRPTLEVRLRDVCPIFVGSGILPDLGSAVRDILAPRRAIVITNATVRDLYGETVLSSLDVAGLSTDLIEVPEGEESKSLQVASDLYGRLVSVNAHRYDPIIALGGGVIGDLAGLIIDNIGAVRADRIRGHRPQQEPDHSFRISL